MRVNKIKIIKQINNLLCHEDTNLNLKFNLFIQVIAARLFVFRKALDSIKNYERSFTSYVRVCTPTHGGFLYSAQTR